MNTETPRPSEFSNKLIIQGIGFELTAAIKQHVHDQAERLFRHEPDIERISFHLEREQLNGTLPEFSARALIAVPGPDISVRETDPDLYKAIADLSHKLDRQLRKRSRRLNSMKRIGTPE